VVQLENHADVTLYHLFESKMPAAETRPAEVSEALR
jgi:hypothetical protein